MKLLLLITVTVLLVKVQSYDEDVFDVKQLMSRIEALERRQVAMENRHQTELSELRSKLLGSVKLFDFYLCGEMCYFHMKNTKRKYTLSYLFLFKFAKCMGKIQNYYFLNCLLFLIKSNE